MRIVAASLFLILCNGAMACAQIIFEPVQYQFGGRSPYYYGGHDPAMHAYANAFTGDPAWGRSQGYAFHSASGMTHREVSHEPIRVLRDELPYENAGIYGYTESDARRAAYADVPRYFQKSELIAAGETRIEPDGSRVVIIPAYARPVVVTRDAPARILPAAVLILPGPPAPAKMLIVNAR